MLVRFFAAGLLAIAIAVPLSCEVGSDARDLGAVAPVDATEEPASRAADELAIARPPAHKRTDVAAARAGHRPRFAVPFRFAAYGDSRSHPDRHQRVIDAIAARAPSLVLFTGDAELSYSPAALDRWLSIVTRHASVAALVSRGRFVVARGNHDSGIDADARWPMLTRQPSGATREERFAFSDHGVFFVSLGCSLGCSSADEAGVQFLAQSLASAEAREATWRVVFAHGPVYDSGDIHRLAGHKPLEDVLDEFNVDVHLAGHDHLYERSHQLRAGQIVDRGNDLRAGAGTVYVVSGGGGAPLYEASSPLPTSHTLVTQVNHFCELEATDASLTVTARRTDGTPIDTFTLRR